MSIEPVPGRERAGLLVAPRGERADSVDGVTALEIRAFLERAERTIGRHRALLDRLDAALGDGDHGENMMIGFQAVAQPLEAADESDVGSLLRHVGHALVASVGGASGPLYGTAFIEAGIALDGVGRPGPRALAEAFEAGTRALARRGRCSVGDKTILDALEPATRALGEAIATGASLTDALARASWAARDGMRATIPLIARRGLALRLGERSRGHQDPGATSCFLLIRAMLPRASRSAGG